MKPHEERVVHERLELAQRLEKLIKFLANQELTASVPSEELIRMHQQAEVMTSYRKILDDRIAAFPPDMIVLVEKPELKVQRGYDGVWLHFKTANGNCVSVNVSGEGSVMNTCILQWFDELRNSKR